MTKSCFLRNFSNQRKDINYILTEILLSLKFYFQNKKIFLKAIRNKFSKKKKSSSKLQNETTVFKNWKDIHLLKAKTDLLFLLCKRVALSFET